MNVLARFGGSIRIGAGIAALGLTLCAFPLAAQQREQKTEQVQSRSANVEIVDLVWSGHRVNSQMIQRGKHQLIVYYDASRQMSIAHRAHANTPWRYHKLPSFVGWDSHNYVTVDVDDAGYIHVMGNMHNDPLVYFRSRNPWDVRSLEQVATMVDAEREKEVTYPRFLHDQEGRLISVFRIGSSGNGNYYYHRFDTASMAWSSLHDSQIYSGEGERGAYYEGPVAGPDGMFHMIWVWRETPSAATNNNLSYVRSPDLVNWEDSNGLPVALPIIRSTGEIVDPVPTFGGILNGQKRLGFDADGLPMISYYKHDSKGDTQIMLARKAGQSWAVHQISEWTDAKQDLDRGGSLNVSFLVRDKPYIAEDGTIRVRALRDGKPIEFTVDPERTTLLATGSYDPTPPIIASFQDNPALQQFIIRADGVPANSGHEFYLSWEANPPNGDRAQAVLPPPSLLRVHKIAH